jgi:hypothetical protein
MPVKDAMRRVERMQWNPSLIGASEVLTPNAIRCELASFISILYH